MGLKSIVLNKRMKFFLNITLTLISSYLLVNRAYPCDAQDIPEPSHLLSCLYSKLHNHLPKSVCPNIAYSILGIPVEEAEKNDLSISSQEHLHLVREDIQHAYVHGLCLQPLLIYEHFQYYKSIPTNLNNALEYLLVEHHNDI